MNTPVSAQLTERFFRYLAVTSQSDAAVATLPSTSGQHQMAQLLAAELCQLGLENIQIDEFATVTARKPGNKPGAPRIGFITHIDTIDVGLNAEIHPQILRFAGEDLCLNTQQDIWLRTKEHPEILAYPDEDIIFSDGTSVLGADNKAAVTVVMTLLANLSATDSHGDIVVAFVPDEEIGLRGAKALDLGRFAVDFAYTIDCCEVGEVVYENFNAAGAEITIEGVTAHPMSAKNVLINPIRIATDIINQFDILDTPEHTAGREGYFWFNELVANANNATLKVSIRDFDLAAFTARKTRLQQVVQQIAALYPRAKVNCTVQDIYSNISNSLGEDKRAIELIFGALAAQGITPKVIAMRGGTDGAALSSRGVFTPNYFTGAHNFHSRFEFLPINAFVKCYQVTRSICLLAARSHTTIR